MTLEARLRDAYEELPVPDPDELDAFDRFRRRRARKAAVTGVGAVLVTAAILAFPLAGVRLWPGTGGAVGPGATALSPPSPSTTRVTTGSTIRQLELPWRSLGIRPAGPARAVAEAGPPGRVRTLVIQRGRYLDRPEFGPVTCMFVLELPVSRFTDDGGGCMPESHPGSPSFDLVHPYAAGPRSKANGLAGSVPHTAERVRVQGRCGWTPVETTTADAGPEFPARFFLVPPQPGGQADTVLAFDAAGRQVARQVLLPPGTDCQGAPRHPG
jgi:hypothetical protein